MGIKRNLYMIYLGFRHILHNVGIISKGQETNYAILQTAHRLEKGLCIREPRKVWGFDKAFDLVRLISKEENKSKPDFFSVETGKAVLYAYLQAKEKKADAEDKEKLARLKESVANAGILYNFSTPTFGGAELLHKNDILVNEKAYEALFTTRHSVRDFADTPVDKDKLEKAISFALRAPSACNRQATQVYVIDYKDCLKAGGKDDFHADKSLIITGNTRAFVMGELNDWIVSTSIFCGYLSLALHAVGIGCCCCRKDIIKPNKYNDNIRKLCHIPDDEQIILEMAIGNYKDEFLAAVSHRRDVKDILHYIS